MSMVDDRNLQSLKACVANILGVYTSELPGDGFTALNQWLAVRNLGLVPVASPESFKWPGRFLGLRRDTATWAVFFGVPPGIVYDPEGEPDGTGVSVDGAFVLAEHNPREAIGRGSGTNKIGTVEVLAIAAEAEETMKVVSTAQALESRGLVGDRYERGAGTFSDPDGRGYDLTLVEAEALEGLAAEGIELEPAQARRNIVVRGIALDDLAGRRFRVGEVECYGQRRCEPCAHLERLTKPGVLRGLVHRGGLRADVISDGVIQTGDQIEALS